MPSIVRKDSMRPEKATLGFQKKRVRVSRSSTNAQSSMSDLKKSSIGDRNSSFDDRNSSFDEGRSSPTPRKLILTKRKSSPDQRKSLLDRRKSSSDQRKSLFDKRKSSSDQRKSLSDKRKSTFDKEKSPDRRKSAFDRRKSSYDQRKSMSNLPRISTIGAIGRSAKDPREFRVSKAAAEIREALGLFGFKSINDPVAFSYYSFSDTDSIKYDEDTPKLRSAKVSTISVHDRHVHRLSQKPHIGKKRKVKKVTEILISETDLGRMSIESTQGLVDSTAGGITENAQSSPQTRSILKKTDKYEERDEFEEKDDSSEDYGPPSEESNEPSTLTLTNDDELDFDFFETLGQIPSIDKISLESSIKEFLKPIQDIVSVTLSGRDLGRFVNPITGLQLSPSPSEMLLKTSKTPIKPSEQEEDFVEEEEEEVVEEESPVIPTDLEEDDELLKLIGLDSDEEEKQYATDEKPPEDTAMDIILYQQKHVLIEEALKEAEEGMDQEEEYALRVNVFEFLQRIINKAVTKVETIRPAVLLRKTLDKHALMDELDAKLDELDVEQKARLFLSRKIVEHFRRKSSFRHIVEDSPNTIMEVMEKYKEALTKLDVVMSKEADLKGWIDIETDKVKEEIQKAEQIERESHDSFEALIKNTVFKENFEYLKKVVDNALKKMAAVRNEISETRFTLITRLHLLGRLKQQNDEMENIGDGWTIRDYENLQAEISLLNKKLEERNIELSRLRNCTTTSVHMFTHLKEKEKMLQNTMAVRQSCLDDLYEEKAEFRGCIKSAQKRRKQLRKEIGDVIIQGGLHGKPALMADYDETVERIRVLKNKVDGMKKKADSLQKRISVYESQMSLQSYDNTDDGNAGGSTIQEKESFFIT